MEYKNYVYASEADIRRRQTLTWPDSWDALFVFINSSPASSTFTLGTFKGTLDVRSLGVNDCFYRRVIDI